MFEWHRQKSFIERFNKCAFVFGGGTLCFHSASKCVLLCVFLLKSKVGVILGNIVTPEPKAKLYRFPIKSGMTNWILLQVPFGTLQAGKNNRSKELSSRIPFLAGERSRISKGRFLNHCAHIEMTREKRCLCGCACPLCQLADDGTWNIYKS